MGYTTKLYRLLFPKYTKKQTNAAIYYYKNGKLIAKIKKWEGEIIKIKIDKKGRDIYRESSSFKEWLRYTKDSIILNRKYNNKKKEEITQWKFNRKDDLILTKSICVI